MKRLFTALLCAVSLCTFAQTDSVSLGAGANNMVFYNLANGSQTSSPNNDWHIAFSARYIAGFTYASTSQAAAVLINEAYGLKLFRCPNQNLAQYASFDTTGWESWQQMHNPDTTWTIGAFNINRNVSDQFNYGWGEYNQGDHNIYSDSSIYLIQMPDGSFKKFAILNLIYDTAFNVQYANLDGSGASTSQIVKNNSKNFLLLPLLARRGQGERPGLGPRPADRVCRLPNARRGRGGALRAPGPGAGAPLGAALGLCLCLGFFSFAQKIDSLLRRGGTVLPPLFLRVGLPRARKGHPPGPGSVGVEGLL